jgi:hypothetical protein
MVYIYLQRRNKSDVRIIGTISSSQEIKASRLNEIDHLGLSAGDRSELKMTLMNYLLDWEPWIESASNYHELRERLIKRGINVPPSANTPIINFEAIEVPKATVVKINKNKTMIRRMS